MSDTAVDGSLRGVGEGSRAHGLRQAERPDFVKGFRAENGVVEVRAVRPGG